MSGLEIIPQSLEISVFLWKTCGFHLPFLLRNHVRSFMSYNVWINFILILCPLNVLAPLMLPLNLCWRKEETKADVHARWEGGMFFWHFWFRLHLKTNWNRLPACSWQCQLSFDGKTGMSVTDLQTCSSICMKNAKRLARQQTIYF